MTKSRINVSIDQDLRQMLVLSNINVSDVVNKYLRVLIEDQHSKVDEKELETEIEQHEGLLNKHRAQLVAKKARLARLREEREEALVARRSRDRFDQLVSDSRVVDWFIQRGPDLFVKFDPTALLVQFRQSIGVDVDALQFRKLADEVLR